MATFQHTSGATRAVTTRALPLVAILVGSGCSTNQAAADAVTLDFDAPAHGFEVSNGWANGDLNGCGWRRDNVSFEDGMLTLTVDDQRSRGRDFSCGEYRSREHYGFGYYETRMRLGRQKDGVVTSFFTYTGAPFGDPHDEIDFEWLNRDTNEVQVNYFVNGHGRHERMIDLGFDASEDFHVYGYEWRPHSIRWYIDCELVHEVTDADGPMPRAQGRIFVHMWNGSELVNDWLGEFEYDGQPVHATFDYIRHVPGGTHDEGSSCGQAAAEHAALDHSDDASQPSEEAPQPEMMPEATAQEPATPAADEKAEPEAEIEAAARQTDAAADEPVTRSETVEADDTSVSAVQDELVLPADGRPIGLGVFGTASQ